MWITYLGPVVLVLGNEVQETGGFFRLPDSFRGGLFGVHLVDDIYFLELVLTDERGVTVLCETVVAQVHFRYFQVFLELVPVEGALLSTEVAEGSLN